MTDEPDVEPRPVPRWLYRLAVAAVLCAPPVLVMGALTTTFGVGMSDPVPSSDPWYLAANSRVLFDEPARGFRLEHTHRLFAWAIGGLAVAVAFGAWRTEPDARLRRFGTLAFVALLLAYAGLHGETRAAWEARKAGGGLAIPWATGALTGVALLGFWGVALAAFFKPAAAGDSHAGRWARLVASVALGLVMVQGLLGGFRVYLDQLFGTQLAAIHGSVAQVTTAVLVAVVALAAPRRALTASAARPLEPVAWVLLAGVLAQLGWGVWMRHLASPVAQRLHLLTAFVVAGAIVWLAARVLTSPARRPLGFFAYHLLGVLGLQLALGVEAYLGKFAVGGLAAQLPVNLRPVSWEAASVRTAHTVLGAALLASAVVLAVRLARARWAGPEVVEVADAEPARRLAAVGSAS